MSLLLKATFLLTILIIISCDYSFIVEQKQPSSTGLSTKSNLCNQTTSGLNLCFNSSGILPISSVKDSYATSLSVNSSDSTYIVGVHEDFVSSEAFIYVQKFSLDGEIDSSYGVGGFSETLEFSAGMEPNPNFLKKAVIDEFGNLYITGYFSESLDYKSYIIKFNSNGMLDSDFDDGSCGAVGGCIIVDLQANSNYEYFNDLFVVGSSIVSLYYVDDTDDYYQIRKYNINNANPVLSFATSGIAQVREIGKSFNGMFLKVDPDSNDIYVVGEYKAIGELEYLFINKIDFNSGLLDSSYGTSGLVKLTSPSEPLIDDLDLTSIQFFDDGYANALVYGMNSFTKENLYIYKFNYKTGVNDSSWDLDGYKIVDNAAPASNPEDSDYQKYLYVNNEHYLCGSIRPGFTSIFTLTKLDSFGELDTSWQDSGFFHNNIDSSSFISSKCDDVSLDANGNVVVLGGEFSDYNLFNFVP